MDASQRIPCPVEDGEGSRGPGRDGVAAVAAVAAVGPVNDADGLDLECPVCCQDYDWAQRCPRELECLHTFCTECLVRLDGRQAGGAPRHICCPLCRHATPLGTPGALALPLQERVLSRLPSRGGKGHATVSRQIILTLDSGETAIVTVPTVSLTVEGSGRTETPGLAHYRLSQKHQTTVCLKKASVRLATLFILICALAFIFAPRLF